MNKKWWVACVHSGSARNSQQGLTLIEVLLALGIIAAVAVTFLIGMSTSSKAVMINQENVTAENLAKSQMESIKHQDYSVDGLYDKLDAGQIPAGYDIEIEAVPLNPRGDTPHNDDGLQEITITITLNEEAIFALQGYKCFTVQ